MNRLYSNDFTFKGISGRQMGVLLTEQPTRTAPKRLVTTKTISGRSGRARIDDGTYDDVTVKLTCAVLDRARMADILAWLTGSGELVLGDEPQAAYDAHIDAAFTRTMITRHLSGQKFTIAFVCDPLRRLYPPALARTFTSSGGILTNIGTAPASPRVTIVGSGEFTLTIGGQTMYFTGVENGIVVDCEEMDAYSPDLTELKNSCIGFTSDGFFSIQPGDNAVSWTCEENASVTSVTILPRWRCF